jgi:hypothetical protein
MHTLADLDKILDRGLIKAAPKTQRPIDVITLCRTEH